jgi:hypothetical protein
MSIKPSYDTGDLVKLDYEYIKIRSKEAGHFRRLNKTRKNRGLPRIDIFNDVFIIKRTQIDDHKMILTSGKTLKNKISFASSYLKSEDPKFIDMNDPHFMFKFIYRPAYMWIPADRSDIKMCQKELAITRSCPFCDEIITVSDNNDKIIITCMKDTNTHSLYLKSQSLSQFPNAALDFQVRLRVNNAWVLETTSHRGGMWRLNGEPYTSSSNPTLITIIARLKKLMAFS